jgi:enoyl-CoA hydratase
MGRNFHPGATMIHREDIGAVTVLRFEHGKANAVDIDLFEALCAQLEQLETEPPRAVVLTGNGSSFSAGVDLNQVVEGGADYLRRFLPLLTRTVRKLFTYPRPVLAAVNGHAIAGGCVLVCACDLRVATTGPAKIGLTELLVGVPFPVAALEAARFALPDRLVQNLVYTGRLLSGQEAQAVGLVDELAEPEALLPTTIARAEQLQRIAPAAFAATKKHLRAATLDRMGQLEISHDDDVIRQWSLPETHERIRGFLAATVGKGKR